MNKYKHINIKNSSPVLKVLVAYHKPTLLFESDIFVPIHAGRAIAHEESKDGVLSKPDYQYMLDSMIGDDTGENISHLNRHFNEMTAIYWAWKNYEAIGDPDYIGLCHYRRFFEDKDIKIFSNFDVLATCDLLANNVEKHFYNSHHTKDFVSICQKVATESAEYQELVIKSSKSNFCYLYNMFIMKKDVFFEYCEFIFPLLFAVHATQNYPSLSFYNQRMPAFIAERLTSVFTLKKEQEGLRIKTCKAKDVRINAKKIIEPAYSNNNIAIVFSADDNYAPYLGIAINSLLSNADHSYNYDICILDGGISVTNKIKLKEFEKDNISIRFIYIDAYIHEHGLELFADTLNAHFTLATYFRFFIPEIFANYNKIIYLDCDVIISDDIAKLYHENIKGKPLAAVKDFEMQRGLFISKQKEHGLANYLTSKLNMLNPDKYFQAGVLVLDIPKLKEINFTRQCIEKLKAVGKPLFVDQCILNSLFDGDIHYLDPSWNVEWHLPLVTQDLPHELPYPTYKEYYKSRKIPKIIHYSGAPKPWRYPHYEWADIWWKYGRTTSFYEEILCSVQNNIRNYTNLKKLNRMALKYKILSKITWGIKRKRCEKKYQHYKEQLKSIL